MRKIKEFRHIVWTFFIVKTIKSNKKNQKNQCKNSRKTYIGVGKIQCFVPALYFCFCRKIIISNKNDTNFAFLTNKPEKHNSISNKEKMVANPCIYNKYKNIYFSCFVR